MAPPQPATNAATRQPVNATVRTLISIRRRKYPARVGGFSQITGVSPMRRAVIICVALALALAGCGGSKSTTSTSTTTSATATSSSANARAAWAEQTEQLCREKRAAIANLGSIHITYGGIARDGLPAVTRLLDRYLARLLTVLREFTQRQRQLATPPSVAATMAQADEVNRRAEAATVRLRRDIARAATAAQFSAAFNVWITTEQRLATRGDLLAQQLDLSGCRSGATAVR